MLMRLMLASLALATLTAVAVVAKTRDDRLLLQGERLLAKLKLVDGPGSGLDADLLQGHPPDAFAAADHRHPELDALDDQQGRLGTRVDTLDARAGSLERRTQCMRVVGDVVIFDGCS